MAQPKILQNLPVPQPRQKRGMPYADLSMPGPTQEESLKQTILNAMTKKMGPDAMAKLLQPGGMGMEGAGDPDVDGDPGADQPGAPDMDQPPVSADQMTPGAVTGPSGASPLPVGPPGGAAGLIARAMPMPPGMQINPADQGASPAAEGRFAAGTAAMDRQIAQNMANNLMQAKKLQASPQELLAAMPPGYSGGQPAAAAALPDGKQALIQALLGRMGVQ